MRKGIIFIIFLVIVAVGYKVIHHFIHLRNSPPTTTISHSITGTELVNIKVDYEDTTILNNNYTVSTENKFSGERSCKLSSTAEYGSCLTIPVSSVRNFKDVNLIELESQIFSDDDAEGKWVIEVDDANGKVVYWQGFPFKASGSTWKNNLFQFKIDAAHIDAKTIKIYPWNVSKKIIFIYRYIKSSMGHFYSSSFISCAIDISV